jgi:hypothetical protein
VDPARFRHRHLRRALDLIPRLAGLALVVALVAVLVGCGSAGTADPTTACQSAHIALPSITAGESRQRLFASANTAFDVLQTLSVNLGKLPSNSQDPEQLANLRNGAALAAVSFEEIAPLFLQPGSGILGPIVAQGRLAYRYIDRASTALGAPACTAPALGSTLLTTLGVQATAPAGPDLAFAGATACTDISGAYGTTQIAIDEKAAITQLERSTAVLRAARNDLADVRSAGGAVLRATLTSAIAVLVHATQQISHGADPSRTSVTAFVRATAVLAPAFRRAHITCSFTTP